MNVTELADHIAQSQSGMTKTQAKAIVSAVFTGIADAALKGEDVSLPGFGKFKVQDKPARTARNPRTGEPIQIAAARKLVFQPAKAVRDTLAK